VESGRKCGHRAFRTKRKGSDSRLAASAVVDEDEGERRLPRVAKSVEILDVCQGRTECNFPKQSSLLGKVLTRTVHA